MARSDIDLILRRGELLAEEIEGFVPEETKTVEFRADLAGLLAVSMAASYESCVKETLTSYASRHHKQFGVFAQNQFQKLNSRVNMKDLYGYALTFDQAISVRFKSALSRRKEAISSRVGKDIVKSYEQILSWRHDFAHAGKRNTTVEEALKTHYLGKRVLYAFDEAFQ